MNYKGYTAKVEFDEDAKLFHGEVLDLSDVITFQSTNSEELEKEFHISVDEYLRFCEEFGKEPEKSFSGKLALRMPKQLHKKLYTNAARAGMSLNEFITRSLDNDLDQPKTHSNMRKVRPIAASSDTRVLHGVHTSRNAAVQHHETR